MDDLITVAEWERRQSRRWTLGEGATHRAKAEIESSVEAALRAKFRCPVSMAGTEGNAVAIIKACALAAERDGMDSDDFRQFVREATSSGGTWGFLEALGRWFEVRL